MKKIPYPSPVDLTRFAENSANPEAFYGLPTEVKFCRKCVISNQRPNSAL